MKLIELIEEEAQDIVAILEDMVGFGGVEMSLRASHYASLLRQRIDGAGLKVELDGITPRREM
jgi:hypothetical protein